MIHRSLQEVHKPILTHQFLFLFLLLLFHIPWLTGIDGVDWCTIIKYSDIPIVSSSSTSMQPLHAVCRSLHIFCTKCTTHFYTSSVPGVDWCTDQWYTTNISSSNGLLFHIVWLTPPVIQQYSHSPVQFWLLIHNLMFWLKQEACSESNWVFLNARDRGARYTCNYAYSAIPCDKENSF
jgi:hypothetical protein